MRESLGEGECGGVFIAAGRRVAFCRVFWAAALWNYHAARQTHHAAKSSGEAF